MYINKYVLYLHYTHIYIYIYICIYRQWRCRKSWGYPQIIQVDNHDLVESHDDLGMKSLKRVAMSCCFIMTDLKKQNPSKSART